MYAVYAMLQLEKYVTELLVLYNAIDAMFLLYNSE